MTEVLRIEEGNLDDPRVVALLEAHLAGARSVTPLCRAFALDVSGLKAPGIAFFAAWLGESVVGMGALRDLGGGHGEIKSMHTAATARGQGVGSAMLAHLLTTAREHGMDRVSLETGTMDYFNAAVALYQRHGFDDCGPFGDYDDDPSNRFLTRPL